MRQLAQMKQAETPAELLKKMAKVWSHPDLENLSDREVKEEYLGRTWRGPSSAEQPVPDKRYMLYVNLPNNNNTIADAVIALAVLLHESGYHWEFQFQRPDADTPSASNANAVRIVIPASENSAQLKTFIMQCWACLVGKKIECGTTLPPEGHCELVTAGFTTPFSYWGPVPPVAKGGMNNPFAKIVLSAEDRASLCGQHKFGESVLEQNFAKRKENFTKSAKFVLKRQ